MANRTPPVGAHCSIAGGHDKALHLGRELGCECVQVFTKNNKQWAAAPLAAEAIERYRTARAETGLTNVFAHSGYLINLCSNKPPTLEKSRQSLLDELERCSQLELPFIVLHPGAHLGAGAEAGIELVIESLDWIFTRYEGKTKIALETTAGQGTTLGADLGELAAIIKGSEHGKRLRVCLDTCHLFAAGFEMRTPESIDAFVRDFKKQLPWSNVVCTHVNDSKHGLGERKDRHEILGKGKIGWTCFQTLLSHPAFAKIPLCLETPKGDDNENDRKTLRKMKAARGATP